MQFTKENVKKAILDNGFVLQEVDGRIMTLVTRIGPVPCGVLEFIPDNQECRVCMKVAEDVLNTDGSVKAKIPVYKADQKILTVINALNIQSLNHPGKWVLSGEGTIDWVYFIRDTNDLNGVIERAFIEGSKELMYRGVEIFDVKAFFTAGNGIREDALAFFKAHSDAAEDLHAIAEELMSFVKIFSDPKAGENEVDGAVINCSVVAKHLDGILDRHGQWISDTVVKTKEWIETLEKELKRKKETANEENNRLAGDAHA